MNPWLAMAVVLGLFALLMAALALYRRRASPDPEWLRKLAHMAMGVATLSFPWLFAETWPVLLLAGAFLAVLVALRLVGPLRQRYGGVLGGVARESHGELYFPVAVALLFWLAAGDKLRFGVPVLILTFADALSALVGVRHGVVRYATDDGEKSVEGSLTFFIVAFLSALVPLLVSDRVSAWQTAWIALCVGLVSTLVEASAWRGLDNLFLPLATFLMLQVYLELTPGEVAVRAAVVAAMFLGLLAWRGRTTLKGGAAAGAALALYVCWAFGGWRWLLPPITLVLAYGWFGARDERNARRVHDNHVVIAVGGAGLAWLFLARALARPEFYFPFTLTFAIHLAVIGLARWRRSAPHLPAAVAIGLCALAAWGLVFGPYLLVAPADGRPLLLSAFAALACIALATWLFCATQPGLANCPNTPERWVRQTGVATVGSLAGLLSVHTF